MFLPPRFHQGEGARRHRLEPEKPAAGATPACAERAADLPNYVLSEFRPRAAQHAVHEERRSRRRPRQAPDLPGVEPISDLPNLHVDRRAHQKVAWSDKLSGYDVEIDHGIGASRTSRWATPRSRLPRSQRRRRHRSGLVSIEVGRRAKTDHGRAHHAQSREVPSEAARARK